MFTFAAYKQNLKQHSPSVQYARPCKTVDGWAHYICIIEPPTVYFSVCGCNIKRRIYLTQYFIVLKIVWFSSFSFHTATIFTHTSISLRACVWIMVLTCHRHVGTSVQCYVSVPTFCLAWDRISWCLGIPHWLAHKLMSVLFSPPISPQIGMRGLCYCLLS